MSREGFIGSLQAGTRDAQMTMARRLDLNFPPPEQNMDLSNIFVGSNTPAMQFQPQRANNVQVIDDEISIVSQTVFSEARKKRLRNCQGPQIMNENMGFHPGCGPMSNEYVEVHCSYGQMPLAGNMRVDRGYRNSGWTNVPISLAPDPSDICTNSQVTGRVEVTIENDVPEEEQASLSCPICISPLRESTTTKCGHVFCKVCIEAAIKAQHKCPTCRRKLKKNDILRIYLPSSV